MLFFSDIIVGTKINFSNILLDKKLHENISVYNISYKTSTGPKPSRIRFDKIDGFITSFDGKVTHFTHSHNSLSIKKTLTFM